MSLDEKNVLYCGMADDIMTPLLLAPNLKKIFVISLFDRCFSSKGTWQSQKNDIKKTLTDGGRHCMYWEREEDGKEFHSLNGEAIILKERDDKLQKRWYLKFGYDGYTRELVYFYDRNFLMEWPEEINSIDVLITIGAYAVRNLCFDKTKEEAEETKLFREMLKTRSNRYIIIYGESYDIKHISGKSDLILRHGKIKSESQIGAKIINTTKIDEIFTGAVCEDVDEPAYPASVLEMPRKNETPRAANAPDKKIKRAIVVYSN